MKTLAAIALAVLMLISLSACTGSKQEAPSSRPEAANTKDDSKTLVVYFSCSGNTKRVAGIIAEATGGALFEILPEEPYSEADLDWRDPESRVSVQHENEAQRDVPLTESKAPGWEDYDTVFVGYPIWYGEAAFPVTTFVKANDFSGKKVIPFCTSTHVDLGDSAKNLAKAAGDKGDWAEGIRFEEKPEESAVTEWALGAAKD